MYLFNFQKKHLLLIGSLIVIFIYLQISQRQDKQSFLEKISYFSLREIQTGSVILRSEIASLIKKYFFLQNLREENRHLKLQLEKILSQNQRFQEVLQENSRLQKALGFYQNSPFALLPAKIIAKDFLYLNNLLVINKGSRHGVKKYMGVMNPKGVVGYVFRVTPHTSDVITLFSALSSLPAVHQKSRINGLVVTYKNDLLSFKYFTSNPIFKTFQIKNRIVTSATKQFPSGLPIGYIEQINSEQLTSTVIVKPYVSFSSLEEVFILTSAVKKNDAN